MYLCVEDASEDAVDDVNGHVSPGMPCGGEEKHSENNWKERKRRIKEMMCERECECVSGDDMCVLLTQMHDVIHSGPTRVPCESG